MNRFADNRTKNQTLRIIHSLCAYMKAGRNIGYIIPPDTKIRSMALENDSDQPHR